MTALSPHLPGPRRPVSRLLDGLRQAPVQVFCLAALLLTVAGFNGRPAFFADTPYYLSQGEALVHGLGLRLGPDLANVAQDPLSVEPGSPGHARALTVAAARSPVYGLLLYACARTGGLWLLVLIQCLAAAWAIVLLVRALAPERSLAALCVSAPALALASSLPFYAAFAMPDLFSGINVALAALVLTAPERLSLSERRAVLGVLAFGAAAHGSNLMVLLMLAVLAPLGLAVCGLPLRRTLPRSRTLAIAALAGLVASTAAKHLCERAAGGEERSPPFLMARLLEDGPGRAYLAAHCPGGASPTLCRFRDRPLDDTEDFLWSGKPGRGVFMTATDEERLLLKREELGFVAGALAQEPVTELRAAIGRWIIQLGLFATVEPLHNPHDWLSYRGWSETTLWKALPGRQACEQGPDPCRPRISKAFVNLAQTLSWTASLAVLSLAAASSDLRAAVRGLSSERRAEVLRVAQAAGVILAAIVLNAGACAVISGAFPRYEARLIWLAPLLAILLLFSLPWAEALQRRRGRSAARPSRLSPTGGLPGVPH